MFVRTQDKKHIIDLAGCHIDRRDNGNRSEVVALDRNKTVFTLFEGTRQEAEQYMEKLSKKLDSFG